MPVPLVTRILVADDHALVREGLKRVLEQEPDFEVAAEAADGHDAVERALSGGIDLAILDISMPRKTGLQAAQELSRRRPEVRTLILSMYENEQFLFEALRSGLPGMSSSLARTTTSSRPAGQPCAASPSSTRRRWRP
jgi:DNA-binding NarL/FixJ family response regulator